LDFPEIAEVEINPLIVYSEGQGALALDSRAILKH
jgi:acetyltransferase